MRLLLCLLAITAWFLPGCGQNPYGNFVEDDTWSLANDAAAQLTALYPPAQTHLVIGVEPVPDDSFGNGLVSALRTAGYGVVEHGDTASEPDGADGLFLAYIIDENENQIRITLFVGADVLSRVYSVKDGEYSPLGGWSRRTGNKEDAR